MAGIDRKLTALEERREQREMVQMKRAEKLRKDEQGNVVQLESSSSSSESRSASPKKADPDYVALEPQPSTSKAG